jgi:hypothetical protein
VGSPGDPLGSLEAWSWTSLEHPLSARDGDGDGVKVQDVTIRGDVNAGRTFALRMGSASPRHQGTMSYLGLDVAPIHETPRYLEDRSLTRKEHRSSSRIRADDFEIRNVRNPAQGFSEREPLSMLALDCDDVTIH